MGDGIPYLPIKKFEAENLERMLEMEVNHDEPGSLRLNQNMEKPKEGVYNGDSYSDQVGLILDGMGLGQYKENFKYHDIGLNILLNMNSADLEVIGITNTKDQATFKRQLQEYNGPPSISYNDLHRIEEDLIMTRNVWSHLEDINAHLTYVHLNMAKQEYEDYFVHSRHSILKVFNIVTNQAMIQAKRMSRLLYEGETKGDNLITACLKADKLELPPYMEVKLRNSKKRINKLKIVSTAGVFGLGICTLVYIYKKFLKK